MMKTSSIIFWFTVSFVFCSSLYAFGRKPPGTIRAKYNNAVVYIDKSPITYMDWFEYVWCAKHLDSIPESELTLFFPDSTFLSYNHFIQVWDSCRYHHLVNIPYNRRVEYAVWRTKRVDNYYISHYGSSPHFKYEVLSVEEFDEICKHNKRLKRNANEECLFRCIVRK